MINKEILTWLLEGDVSIQYQTCRDLLDTEKPALRNKIAKEGWGLRFLSCRHQNGYWGTDFYQPKWISTHYTLLDLKNLNIAAGNKMVSDSLKIIFENEKGPDGGILPIGTIKASDVCVNGMVLNYSAYFRVKEDHLKSVVDFLLDEKMNDGGFNCQSNRNGARSSSLHSTLSVIEGILEYRTNGYKYRLNELIKAEASSQEFILQHKLFRSIRTGEIIKSDFLKFYYPCRWYYDILKAMDYFQAAKVKYDSRMDEAISIITGKRTKNGVWKQVARHPGKTHFEMEKAGEPGRWNTLRALRVLKYFNFD